MVSMMMVAKRLVRSLRSTIVLGAVFSFSFLYFAIKSGILVWTMQTLLTFYNQDVEERLLDKYKLNAHRQIQWLADSADHRGADRNGFNESLANSDSIVCRNTRQGRTSVTDDRGYTCERVFLKINGCCEVRVQSTRFSCTGCDQKSGCCVYYEQCVSCCLRPEQKNVLLEMIQSTSGHRLRQILSAKDQFELCMLKCRTSSNSVYSENKYKSENLKHCYKQEPDQPFAL